MVVVFLVVNFLAVIIISYYHEWLVDPDSHLDVSPQWSVDPDTHPDLSPKWSADPEVSPKWSADPDTHSVVSAKFCCLHCHFFAVLVFVVIVFFVRSASDGSNSHFCQRNIGGG